MLIKNKRSWEIPESEATPEHIYWSRRDWIKAAGVAVAGSILPPGIALASDDPSAGLYPAPRNEAYTLDRDLTREEIATSYNNFYEFGSHKQIAERAQDLKIRPWTVKIDGMVDNAMELDINDLLKKVTLEERLYRFRCVEAWAMAVPWTGFPMADLVKMAGPQAGAKYVRMETFLDPKVARGQKQRWYPWPYVEALTLEEATNEMAFMVTGLYGKPLPRQNGAPLRLAVPWKFGFKNIKSIVRFTFTDEKPTSFWEDIQPSEYGFWANVNPEVPHPRWSQASEQLIGTIKRRKTLLFNGYEEQVAHLYKDMKQGDYLYR